MWYIDGHQEAFASQGCSVPQQLFNLQGYNKPDMHGHKQKNTSPLSQGKIMEHMLAILHITQQSYTKREVWASICDVLLKLSVNLRKYLEMLLANNEKSQEAHWSKKLFYSSSIEILEPKISTKPTIVARYKSLFNAVAMLQLEEA